MSVVGARPQFVKLAPVAHEISAGGHQHVIVHTGQHYDVNMSDNFFADLNIPDPDVHLGIGSGTHGVQTGAMLAALDAVLLDEDPDWVLVYGDTNSTLAAALAAVKLNFAVGHLEAGLRSFNRLMPEEHNRVLTDHAADLCMAPTEIAYGHLVAEGLGSRSVVTGDVMADVCLSVARASDAIELPWLRGNDDEYTLATVHRAENTDDPVRLSLIIDGLQSIPGTVILTAHPRLLAKAALFGIPLGRDGLDVVEPLNYPSMVAATKRARMVVTDSGGLQKEAFLLRTPCTTVRTETEWTETVELGWNVLCPNPGNLSQIVGRPAPPETEAMPYGAGDAAQRVLRVLEDGLP